MSNPFAEDENPFDDNTSGSNNKQKAAPVEVYNPFESQGTNDDYGSYKPPTVQPAAAVTSNPQVKTTVAKNKADADVWDEPVKAPSAPAMRGGDISAREADLRRREAELEEREKRLVEREKLIRSQGLLPYNWPFKCWSITYHSITDEIPAEYQVLVSRAYVLLLSTWVALIWNWIVVWGMWLASDGGGSGGYALWATVYVVIGIPGGWLLWYRPLYYGARDDSSGRWGMYLFHKLCHTLFCLVMAIGIQQTAAAGMIAMIDLYGPRDKKALGTMALISTFFWLVLTLTSGYILKEAYTQWRENGGKEKAEKEARQAKMVADVVV